MDSNEICVAGNPSPIHVARKPKCCRFCNRPFKYLGCLQTHEEKCSSQKAKDRNSISCQVCGKAFANVVACTVHMLTQHSEDGLFKCFLCGSEFLTYHTLLWHFNQHLPEEMLVCSKCTKIFPSVDTLERHCCVNLGGNLLTCSKCSIEFDDHCQFITDHPCIMVNNAYTCPCCHYCTTRMSDFKEHWGRHTGEGLFTCETCNKKLFSERSLYCHRRRRHNQEEPVTCQICGKIFNGDAELVNHGIAMHGPKKFKCPFCPMAYARECLQKTHTNSVHIRKNLDRTALGRIVGELSPTSEASSKPDTILSLSGGKGKYEQVNENGKKLVNGAGASSISVHIKDSSRERQHSTHFSKQCTIKELEKDPQLLQGIGSDSSEELSSAAQPKTKDKSLDGIMEDNYAKQSETCDTDLVSESKQINYLIFNPCEGKVRESHSRAEEGRKILTDTASDSAGDSAGSSYRTSYGRLVRCKNKLHANISPQVIFNDIMEPELLNTILKAKGKKLSKSIEKLWKSKETTFNKVDGERIDLPSPGSHESIHDESTSSHKVENADKELITASQENSHCSISACTIRESDSNAAMIVMHESYGPTSDNDDTNTNKVDGENRSDMEKKGMHESIERGNVQLKSVRDHVAEAISASHINPTGNIDSGLKGSCKEQTSLKESTNTNKVDVEYRFDVISKGMHESTEGRNDELTRVRDPMVQVMIPSYTSICGDADTSTSEACRKRTVPEKKSKANEEDTTKPSEMAKEVIRSNTQVVHNLSSRQTSANIEAPVTASQTGISRKSASMAKETCHTKTSRKLKEKEKVSERFPIFWQNDKEESSDEEDELAASHANMSPKKSIGDEQINAVEGGPLPTSIYDGAKDDLQSTSSKLSPQETKERCLGANTDVDHPTQQLDEHQRTRAKGKGFRRTCAFCGKGFETVLGLLRHEKYDHQNKCSFCSRRFSKCASLKRHLCPAKKKVMWTCQYCGEQFECSTVLEEHRKTHHTSRQVDRTVAETACEKQLSSLLVKVSGTGKRTSDVLCDDITMTNGKRRNLEPPRLSGVEDSHIDKESVSNRSYHLEPGDAHHDMDDFVDNSEEEDPQFSPMYDSGRTANTEPSQSVTEVVSEGHVNFNDTDSNKLSSSSESKSSEHSSCTGARKVLLEEPIIQHDSFMRINGSEDKGSSFDLSLSLEREDGNYPLSAVSYMLMSGGVSGLFIPLDLLKGIQLNASSSKQEERSTVALSQISGSVVDASARVDNDSCEGADENVVNEISDRNSNTLDRTLSDLCSFIEEIDVIENSVVSTSEC